MSTRQKIYLYIGIFVGVSLLFGFGVIPYFLGGIRENSESLVSLKRELVSLQKERENFKQLEVVYQSYQKELARIDTMLIDPEVPVEFIDFLEKNARISEQEIEISLSSQRKEKEELWPALFFQISTSGSFPEFLKFLEKLENSPYLIQILNLNIQELTEGNIESGFLIKVFAKR